MTVGVWQQHILTDGIFLKFKSNHMAASNRMHTDRKKRRSSYLVAPLFADGNARRWRLAAEKTL
jgi:hypothetical protein